MSKTKNLKKILISLAIVGIALSVSACGNKQDTSEQIATPPNVLDTTSKQNSNLNLAETATTSAPVATPVATDKTAATETPAVTNTIMSPDKQEDLTKTYSQAILKTSLGNITVKFYASESPVTVNNFLNLAKAGFYNGTKFHRVIKDFMIQGGDPLSKEANTAVWGTGGPDYRFDDEFNSHKLVAGSLAMANSGSNTNGSQFFIVTATETPWLDGKHTNFGYVVSGMDIVKKIEATQTGASDRPLEDITINSIELVK